MAGEKVDRARVMAYRIGALGLAERVRDRPGVDGRLPPAGLGPAATARLPRAAWWMRKR